MIAQTLIDLHAKATEGPWWEPHLSRDDISCDCAYILAEGYMGSICDICFNNGLKVGEGGNDSPPLDEAKANGKLIAFLRNHAQDFIKLVQAAEAANKSHPFDGAWRKPLSEALAAFKEKS